MQRNVCGSEVQRAAFDGEILLGIDCVIDGGIDVQRQLADGEGGFAFLCGGRAGLDAVFAVGVECQRPGAVSALVRLRPLRISLTPVVPFLILTEPSVHEPESR